MSKPLFSIITATYNAGRAINIAAASIRAQGRSDIEYIIVDGGSTDNTLAEVERNRDVVTKIVSEPDRGIYDALNKGIALAKGELIGIIGADDAYLPGALNIVARAYRDRPADVYAGRTLLTDGEGKGTLRADEAFGPGALVSGIPFGHNALFVRRAAYQQVGHYDLKYRICGDANWVHRAIRAGLTCESIPRVLVQFSPTGLSTDDDEGIIRESAEVIVENFPGLSVEEGKGLLYGVRGWTGPGEVVEILRRHKKNRELRESVAAAFADRPALWADLLTKIEAPARGRRAAASAEPERRRRQEKPLFSFIIPAYNVADYIGRCLDSILAQSVEELEVIVVDDGTTDQTATVVERYAAQDGRVELIRQANAGQGAARSAALERARGEFVWCVDSDDRIQEQVLARLIGIMRRTDADVAVLNFAFEFEDGRIEYNRSLPALAGKTLDPLKDEQTFSALSAWSCPPWRYLIRRSLLKSAGVTFPKGMFYEDHPFAINLISSAARVHVDSTMSYYYLQRSGSTVRSKDRRVFDFLRIRRMVLKSFREKGLLGKFPTIALSYVLPIKFIKAHVGEGERLEFLTKLFADTSAEEIKIARRWGRAGEFALLDAAQDGTLESLDFTGLVSSAGDPLDISATLTAADVEGLSTTEGPYPELGIDGAFRWVEGHVLKVRARGCDEKPTKLRIRYRNTRPGQMLTVEQNDKSIEVVPCRSDSQAQLGELLIPLLAEDVVWITITARLIAEDDPRQPSIAIQEVDVVAADADDSDEHGGERLLAPDLVAKGDGTNIGGLHVDVRRDIERRTYVHIGRESDIGGTMVFERGVGEIRIGDRSSIGGGCLLICSQADGIRIGSNVMLSWNVTVIDTDAHSLDPAVRANDAHDWLVGEMLGQRGLYKDWINVNCAPIVIEDGAWIGFGSSILKGVTIGKGAVIGCNSVVTKDIPDYAIAAGNPARIVGQVPAPTGKQTSPSVAKLAVSPA